MLAADERSTLPSLLAGEETPARFLPGLLTTVVFLELAGDDVADEKEAEGGEGLAGRETAAPPALAAAAMMVVVHFPVVIAHRFLPNMWRMTETMIQTISPSWAIWIASEYRARKIFSISGGTP